MQSPPQLEHQSAQQESSPSTHNAAWRAASSVPQRRNRPADLAARQERRRLRKTYAEYSNLPTELQDNEFITTGYRTELGVWDSIKSMFGLHNETGNIWTHLIGSARLCWCVSHQPWLTLPQLILICTICRIHTLSGAYTCHHICQTSPPHFSLPRADAS